ncbi:MAG: hypothetical protein ACRCV3_00790 [Desulfovibrionaceae bacterium]
MLSKKYSMKQEGHAGLISDVIFWLLFSVFAIWIQKAFAGIDTFLVGLIIILQEKKWRSFIVIAIFSIFIQEGLGIFNFGMMLCWYGMLVLLFIGGSNFFEVDKIYFVTLLSILLAIIKIPLLFIFASAQNIHVVFSIILRDALLQILIIPILWMPIYFLRKRFANYGNTV